MKAIRLITATILVLLCCQDALPYADQFKAAVVRIYNKNRKKEGTGFILVSAPEKGEAYIITAAHVVYGDDSPAVQFYETPTAVTGQVIKRWTELEHPVGTEELLDLAVVLVRSDKKLPGNIMNLALAPESHIKGGEFADVIGMPVSGIPWSILRFSIQGETKEQGVLFSGFFPGAVSGAPLVLDDLVVGMVVRSGNVDEPSIAIPADNISALIKGVVPTTPTPSPPPPPDGRPLLRPDEPVVDSATTFLDLLGKNRLQEAYNSMPEFVRNVMSESRFQARYKDYVPAAVSGLLERKLADSMDMPSIPGTQIVGDTYVLTFETRFRAYPYTKFFENVTVFKQDSIWRVVDFQGNSTPVTGNEGPVPTQKPRSQVENDEAEASEVALSALTLLHDNKLPALYRDLISNLQKNTRLRSEAACVSAFTDYVVRWPGAPKERTLLQALPQESEPYFFGAFNGQFYYLVFLAKYPQGNVHEQVYLVKEDSQWKVAVLLLKDAY